MQHRTDRKGYHGIPAANQSANPWHDITLCGDLSPSLPAGVIFRERAGLLQELGRQGGPARRYRHQDDLSHDCVCP